METPNKSNNQPRLVLCYSDTGGTFTDTFVVDETGDFIVGKAPTTPQDLTEGYFNSVANAAEARGLSLQEAFSQLSVVGHGTTTVINTILIRGGPKLGVIITRGFEQTMHIGRSKQSWVGDEIVDRIHVRAHRRDEPLVPFKLIKGVSERIDALGNVIIPLYENDVRKATEQLLDEGVQGLVICFLFSWQNAVHEEKARDIVKQVCQERGKDVPVYISTDISPVTRELSRLNAAVIEAYAGPRVRQSYLKTQERLKKYGFKGDFLVMQSWGGLASAQSVKVVNTLLSGPVGGYLGGRYIGEIYGFKSLITTDVGGTSFDVGLITDGLTTVDREPVCCRMVLATPAAEVTSIGAGGGTMAYVDKLTGRLTVGPVSAQAVPGPVCYDRGGETPTVTDADLALGYIDPDYFLGGRIKLNKAKALRSLREKIADPLGVSVEEAASGINRILDMGMKDTILGMVGARGYAIEQYYLLAFGGGGPTHVAGYTKGLPVKGVMAFLYSAAFSAFGAASADFERRYNKATYLVIPPSMDDKAKIEVGKRINALWQSLADDAYADMEADGFSRDKVKLQFLANIRYGRQLDDLIVPSPVTSINSPRDWDALMAAFERMYEKIYAVAAKYPQAGYEIFEVGLQATAPKIKPVLKKHPFTGEKPPEEAAKNKRNCYFNNEWVTTNIYQWDLLRSGNLIHGPAILESPSTNLVVPPGKIAVIDEYLTAWLK